MYLPRYGCRGVEGVAGTLEALRLKLDERCTVGSSRPGESLPSRISRSVRPLYLNFVPQENKPPPDITGASELFGSLKITYEAPPHMNIQKILRKE